MRDSILNTVFELLLCKIEIVSHGRTPQRSVRLTLNYRTICMANLTCDEAIQAQKISTISEINVQLSADHLHVLPRWQFLSR